MNFIKLTIITSLTLSIVTVPAGAQNILRKLFPSQEDTVRSKDENTEKTRKKTFSFKSKNMLLKENEGLKKQIDSLRNDIEQYRNDLHLNDSVRSELIDIYEENENKSAAGLNPEDYDQDISDSLLSIWYLHNQLKKNSEFQDYDMDSVHFSSNVPDSVFIRRLSEMNSFITLPFNETVKNYIILYSEKMPEKMSKILALCKYYMPIFEETFNKYDLPEELKIMAIIESAMNPTAISPAGAKGMWQFMYSTAKNYGLKIDSFVDERLDPVKSADAAARYLRDSYNIFGDWNLAISSYNCGAGNVSKAIKRSGGKRDFWSIYPYLPRETRGYVPAFVGAMYATTYYKEHGIVPEEIQLPAHIDTFEIHKMLHFKQINQVVGVPVDMLRNLNPQYTHDIIPGNEGTFILRIPYTYTNAFLDSEDSLYTYKAEDLFSTVNINKIKQNSPYGNGTRIVYRVRKGDYMGRIARRYHVSVSQLKKWNHLRSSNLKIGQKLVIYRKGAPSYSGSASQSSSSCTASTESDQSDDSYSSYTLYTVKDGDTLYSIAKRFKGISANNIMEYNKIGSDIHPGMKIRIPR